jgi:hypothetical protein
MPLVKTLTCPNGCENLQVQPLHSFAQATLNRVLLWCPRGPKCQVKVKYEDYYKHVKHGCGEIQGQCECGEQLKQADFAKHVQKECRLTIVKCNECQLEMKRESLHRQVGDCLKDLMTERQQLLNKLS